MTTHPIVVLTPVRNEAWILERFLSVTTRWADLVLICDQGSTDGSREICDGFSPKVQVIANSSTQFNEAERQDQLLAEARERWPGTKILLALDADELVAADGPGAPGWQKMLRARAGTVLCFEKPDLWNGVEECVRYTAPWPIGYVDDGAPHRPRPIHSIRVPTPCGAPRLHLDDVKILHFAMVRAGVQQAKARFYAVQENLLGSAPLYLRREHYAADRDWSASGRLARAEASWFAGWEALGIDLHSFRKEAFYWQDFEVLRVFSARGVRRFWLENIWEFDWEACRRAALQRGLDGIPSSPIRTPPVGLRLAGRALDALYARWRRGTKQSQRRQRKSP